jgi:hypothetical protein
MGAVQLGSLCVRIKASSPGSSSVDVAVIFADPTNQELDYLFGNKNLTRYVLRLLSDQPLTDNSKQAGFLDSLDYIASHLKAELANRSGCSGNLDIAPVKDEIKMEESLDSLLNGTSAASAGLLNGGLDEAVDNVDDDDEDYLLRNDEGLLDEEEDEVAEKRVARSRRTKRPRRAARRTRTRLKEDDEDPDVEMEEAQADKKHWPYIKVRSLKKSLNIVIAQLHHVGCRTAPAAGKKIYGSSSSDSYPLT